MDNITLGRIMKTVERIIIIIGLLCERVLFLTVNTGLGLYREDTAYYDIGQTGSAGLGLGTDQSFQWVEDSGVAGGQNNIPPPIGATTFLTEGGNLQWSEQLDDKPPTSFRWVKTFTLGGGRVAMVTIIDYSYLRIHLIDRTSFASGNNPDTFKTTILEEVLIPTPASGTTAKNQCTWADYHNLKLYIVCGHTISGSPILIFVRALIDSNNNIQYAPSSQYGYTITDAYIGATNLAIKVNTIATPTPVPTGGASERLVAALYLKGSLTNTALNVPSISSLSIFCLDPLVATSTIVQQLVLGPVDITNLHDLRFHYKGSNLIILFGFKDASPQIGMRKVADLVISSDLNVRSISFTNYYNCETFTLPAGVMDGYIYRMEFSSNTWNQSPYYYLLRGVAQKFSANNAVISSIPIFVEYKVEPISPTCQPTGSPTAVGASTILKLKTWEGKTTPVSPSRFEECFQHRTGNSGNWREGWVCTQIYDSVNQTLFEASFIDWDNARTTVYHKMHRLYRSSPGLFGGFYPYYDPAIPITNSPFQYYLVANDRGQQTYLALYNAQNTKNVKNYLIVRAKDIFRLKGSTGQYSYTGIKNTKVLESTLATSLDMQDVSPHTVNMATQELLVAPTGITSTDVFNLKVLWHSNTYFMPQLDFTKLKGNGLRYTMNRGTGAMNPQESMNFLIYKDNSINVTAWKNVTTTTSTTTTFVNITDSRDTYCFGNIIITNHIAESKTFLTAYVCANNTNYTSQDIQYNCNETAVYNTTILGLNLLKSTAQDRFIYLLFKKPNKGFFLAVINRWIAPSLPTIQWMIPTTSPAPFVSEDTYTILDAAFYYKAPTSSIGNPWSYMALLYTVTVDATATVPQYTQTQLSIYSINLYSPTPPAIDPPKNSLVIFASIMSTATTPETLKLIQNAKEIIMFPDENRVAVSVLNATNSNDVIHNIVTLTRNVQGTNLGFQVHPKLPPFRLRRPELLKSSNTRMCMFGDISDNPNTDGLAILYYYKAGVTGSSDGPGAYVARNLLKNNFDTYSTGIAELEFSDIQWVSCDIKNNRFAIIGVAAKDVNSYTYYATFDVTKLLISFTDPNLLTERIKEYSPLTINTNTTVAFYENMCWYFGGSKRPITSVPGTNPPATNEGFMRILNESWPQILVSVNTMANTNMLPTISVYPGNKPSLMFNIMIPITSYNYQNTLTATVSLPAITGNLSPNTLYQFDKVVQFNGSVLTAEIVGAQPADSSLVTLNPRIVFDRTLEVTDIPFRLLAQIHPSSKQIAQLSNSHRLLQSSGIKYNAAFFKVRDNITLIAYDSSTVTNGPLYTRFYIYFNTDVLIKSLEHFQANSIRCTSADFILEKPSTLHIFAGCTNLVIVNSPVNGVYYLRVSLNKFNVSSYMKPAGADAQLISNLDVRYIKVLYVPPIQGSNIPEYSKFILGYLEIDGQGRGIVRVKRVSVRRLDTLNIVDEYVADPAGDLTSIMSGPDYSKLEFTKAESSICSSRGSQIPRGFCVQHF
jgi:hypothetical protein